MLLSFAISDSSNLINQSAYSLNNINI